VVDGYQHAVPQPARRHGFAELRIGAVQWTTRRTACALQWNPFTERRTPS